ncbi:MAG TPA: hypothetical protein VLC07_05770 [Solirubrobacterales bacterium]|nr:hypothetical protein [Solirubrobacterales bacterium]
MSHPDPFRTPSAPDESRGVAMAEGRAAFAPREAVSGTVSWRFAEPPSKVELRLLWYTEGRGERDLSVVQVVPFDAPGADDRRSFQIELPPGPYSFTGRLVSLRWALEAVAEPGDRSARAEITVAPEGREVRLDPGVG